TIPNGLRLNFNLAYNIHNEELITSIQTVLDSASSSILDLLIEQCKTDAVSIQREFEESRQRFNNVLGENETDAIVGDLRNVSHPILKKLKAVHEKKLVNLKNDLDSRRNVYYNGQDGSARITSNYYKHTSVTKLDGFTRRTRQHRRNRRRGKRNHKKKIKPPQFIPTEEDLKQFDPINLTSNVILSKDQIRVCRLPDCFAPTPKEKIDVCDQVVGTYAWAERLRWHRYHYLKNSDGEEQDPTEPFEKLPWYQPTTARAPKACRYADKSGVTVITSLAEDDEKVLSQISDPEHYDVLPEDPTPDIIVSVKSFCNKWQERGNFSKEIAQYVSGVKEAKPGNIKPLIKTHKPKPYPTRILLSGSGTPVQPLSKLIQIAIRHLTQFLPYQVMDTKEFLQKIEEINDNFAPLPNTACFAVCDVVALYPNVNNDMGVPATGSVYAWDVRLECPEEWINGSTITLTAFVKKNSLATKCTVVPNNNTFFRLDGTEVCQVIPSDYTCDYTPPETVTADNCDCADSSNQTFYIFVYQFVADKEKHNGTWDCQPSCPANAVGGGYLLDNDNSPNCASVNVKDPDTITPSTPELSPIVTTTTRVQTLPDTSVTSSQSPKVTSTVEPGKTSDPDGNLLSTESYSSSSDRNTWSLTSPPSSSSTENNEAPTTSNGSVATTTIPAPVTNSTLLTPTNTRPVTTTTTPTNTTPVTTTTTPTNTTPVTTTTTPTNSSPPSLLSRLHLRSVEDYPAGSSSCDMFGIDHLPDRRRNRAALAIPGNLYRGMSSCIGIAILICFVIAVLCTRPPTRRLLVKCGTCHKWRRFTVTLDDDTLQNIFIQENLNEIFKKCANHGQEEVNIERIRQKIREILRKRGMADIRNVKLNQTVCLKDNESNKWYLQEPGRALPEAAMKGGWKWHAGNGTKVDRGEMVKILQIRLYLLSEDGHEGAVEMGRVNNVSNSPDKQKKASKKVESEHTHSDNRNVSWPMNYGNPVFSDIIRVLFRRSKKSKPEMEPEVPLDKVSESSADHVRRLPEPKSKLTPVERSSRELPTPTVNGSSTPREPLPPIGK
ncbi:hypothetical protein BaRGS_00033670, partial [Batillaria attramentaria]